MTLLQTLDSVSAHDPDRLYGIQPVSSDLLQGWRNISYADLQGAVNHMVGWIQERVAGNQVLAYVGANDVCYAAFIFACMRLRHIVRQSLNDLTNDSLFCYPPATRTTLPSTSWPQRNAPLLSIPLSDADRPMISRPTPSSSGRCPGCGRSLIAPSCLYKMTPTRRTGWPSTSTLLAPLVCKARFLV